MLGAQSLSFRSSESNKGDKTCDYNEKINEGLLHSGCPSSSDGKESTCNATDLGSISGLERSLGKENDNPLQYSCLENPMDRGAWWTIAHSRKELHMAEHYYYTSYQNTKVCIEVVI